MNFIELFLENLLKFQWVFLEKEYNERDNEFDKIIIRYLRLEYITKI